MHELLGRTRDDAAGEAFDKVAKLLGLGYPGGPIIDRLSEGADPGAVAFTIARMKDGSPDFSFSGIKTAVLLHVRREGIDPVEDPADVPVQVRDLVASFQGAVVDALVRGLARAAREHSPPQPAPGRRGGRELAAAARGRRRRREAGSAAVRASPLAEHRQRGHDRRRRLRQPAPRRARGLGPQPRAPPRSRLSRTLTAPRAVD